MTLYLAAIASAACRSTPSLVEYRMSPDSCGTFSLATAPPLFGLTVRQMDLHQCLIDSVQRIFWIVLIADPSSRSRADARHVCRWSFRSCGAIFFRSARCQVHASIPARIWAGLWDCGEEIPNLRHVLQRFPACFAFPA